jgi:CTP synthase (UTP-ammonia lyase)
LFAEARAIYPLDEKRKEKIAFNCGVPKENIISAPYGGTMRLGDWKC